MKWLVCVIFLSLPNKIIVLEVKGTKCQLAECDAYVAFRIGYVLINYVFIVEQNGCFIGIISQQQIK
jgi:hypothetical protein